MRIGLVPFLNTQPLEFGVRRHAGERGWTLIEDVPSVLARKLVAGEVDAAIISSVECLRHQDKLSWCDKVGVSAKGAVGSIVCFRRKGDTSIPSRILADYGSRTSAALLQVLFFQTFGRVIPLEERRPETIARDLREGEAGLLIGDTAMHFLFQKPAEFDARDLGEWWNTLEKRPFIFALWAFSRERPIGDDLFLESLREGLAAIEEIIRGTNFPNARPYLTQSLHYQLDSDDLSSLPVFWERLQAAGLA